MTAVLLSGTGDFIHKAGYVVPVDVAPDVPLMRMRWLREMPVLIVSKKSVV